MNSKFLSPKEAHALATAAELGNLKSSPISDHFTWGEVFKNCTDGEIKECPEMVFNNAVKQAATMEQVRLVFGRPILVDCWYRGPEHNAKVGGKPSSYHMKGLATDFNVEGYADVAGNKYVQNKLDQQKFMGHCGLERTGGVWTHVDTRGYKSRF